MTIKKMIAAVVLFLLGAAALLFGLFFSGETLNKEADLDIGVSEIKKLKNDNVGRTVKLKLTNEQHRIDDNNYFLICSTDSNTTLVRIKVGDELAGGYKKIAENGVTIIGTVRASAQEITEETYDAVIAYYEALSADTGFEVTDSLKFYVRKNISPYYIELTDAAAAFSTDALIVIKIIAFGGCGVLFLAAAAELISFLTKKALWKIALIVFGTAAVIAAAALIVLFPKLKLLSGIRKDAEGVYYMEYTDKLKFDEMLAASITSADELFSWVSGAEFFGLPLSSDIDRYGCSSFCAKSQEGDVLFGRNFDYGETDVLIVHSKPKDGYAFYGAADLYVLGVSKSPGCVDPDSLPGRALMLAAPYVVCDGMNEAGLGLSVLHIDLAEIHQDTGKTDLFIYTAIPLILERCATVDEATALLGSYDIHSHNGVMGHLFIADKTGRSAVVEWLDGEMYVNELNACTNSVLTPSRYYGIGGDERLSIIKEGLSEHNDILTKDQAKELLEAAAQKDYTEWSCVYDLTGFSLDIYVDLDYDRAYHYGGEG